MERSPPSVILTIYINQEDIVIKTSPEASTQAVQERDQAGLALPEMELPLGEEDGWQIARASFGRELVHYSLRGGIALALLAGLVFAIFWAYNQVVKMPPAAVNGAQKMIAPIFKVLPFSGTAGGTTGSKADGAGGSTGSPVGGKSANALDHSTSLVNKSKGVGRHPKRHFNRQIASRGHGHVRPVQAGDNPTGGRVIYSDGMITEYSWK